MAAEVPAAGKAVGPLACYDAESAGLIGSRYRRHAAGCRSGLPLRKVCGEPRKNLDRLHLRAEVVRATG